MLTPAELLVLLRKEEYSVDSTFHRVTDVGPFIIGEQVTFGATGKKKVWARIEVRLRLPFSSRAALVFQHGEEVPDGQDGVDEEALLQRALDRIERMDVASFFELGRQVQEVQARGSGVPKSALERVIEEEL